MLIFIPSFLKGGLCQHLCQMRCTGAFYKLVKEKLFELSVECLILIFAV